MYTSSHSRVVVLGLACVCGCAGADTPIIRTADETGTSGTTAFGDPHPPDGPRTTTGRDEASTTGSTGSDPSGHPFIEYPDGGGSPIECSIWDEDCPPGEKCMPWANDGGNSWNATKCSPIDPNPADVGEPCEVVDSGVSGVDNCVLHSMCWNVDPETNTGTCFGFCIGTESNPFCEDPDAVCSIASDGVLTLCRPRCHPLEQNCPDGLGCYGINQGFECVPDASGDTGAAGDPCEYINVCDPGLECVQAKGVPGCAVASGCCSPHCDLADPNASASCPGADEGQQCVPWFEEGEAPRGYENVGICFIPPPP